MGHWSGDTFGYYYYAHSGGVSTYEMNFTLMQINTLGTRLHHRMYWTCTGGFCLVSDSLEGYRLEGDLLMVFVADSQCSKFTYIS